MTNISKDDNNQYHFVQQGRFYGFINIVVYTGCLNVGKYFKTVENNNSYRPYFEFIGGCENSYFFII